MTDEAKRSASGNPTLESVIAAYLEESRAGRTPDRQFFVDNHPELADALTSFFANHDQLRDVVPEDTREKQPESEDAATIPPELAAGDDVTLPPNGPAVSDDEDRYRVRYFGDYELLEEIARGGMGVVYKARQVNLNRTVALKMILAGQFASPEDVQRFYTEAEAAANLDHPGIVPIHEVGEHDGHHFYSMAFIEGVSLGDVVSAGPLSPPETARITRFLAEAMAYAHERGVIHRDLKPINVLLSRVEGQRPTAVLLKTEGVPTGWYEPKVVDFGLAKKTEGESELTGTGQILGTPNYMPPEQASGKANEVGPLADLYSIGAILYCLLTARPPFQAETVMDTLVQVLEQEPIPPSEINPGVPKDLETLCVKCLEKDPLRRLTSVRELSDELGRYLRGEPILTRRVGLGERIWRWAKRRPGVAGALTLAVMLACGFTISGGFAGILAGIPILVGGIMCLALVLRAEKKLVAAAFLSAGTTLAVAGAEFSSNTLSQATIAATLCVLSGLIAAAMIQTRLWVGLWMLGIAPLFAILAYQNGSLRSFAAWLSILVLLTCVVGIPSRLVAWWLDKELFAPALGSFFGLIIGGLFFTLLVRIILNHQGIDNDTIWLVLSVTLMLASTGVGALLGALGGRKKNDLIDPVATE